MPADRKRSHAHDESSDRAHKKHKSKRKDKVEKEGRSRKRDNDRMEVVDDDDGGEDGVWVEKNVGNEGEDPLATTIPASASLDLKSHTSARPISPPTLPPSLVASSSTRERDAWMLPPTSYTDTKPTVPSPLASHPIHAEQDEALTDGYGEERQDVRTLDGGVDFFGAMGTEKVRKGKEVVPAKPAYSARELNPDINPNAQPLAPSTTTSVKAPVPGGPGSSWRMLRLRRVYEEAETSGRPVEEVAKERYESAQAWEEALEERRVLDERDGRRRSSGEVSDGRRRDRDNRDGDGEERRERYMFTEVGGGSRPTSRASFRRPGDSQPTTPGPGTPSSRPSFIPRTSLPAALTPSRPQHPPRPSGPPPDLNKLQARVLRAKLMGAPDAGALQREYDEAVKRAVEEGGAGPEGGVGVGDRKGVSTEMVSTIDAQGRLYDLGSGGAPLPPGNERKAKPMETRDPKTDSILRINDDDDTLSLGDMLREERAVARSAGADMDSELAARIAGDGKFEDGLEYMDERAETLARKRMRSDAMKRAFAINDYARTKKALDTCPFCFSEDDSPPRAGIIAQSPRAYLAVPTVEELVEGHCYIVPVQHHLTMLEAEDDVWDEVKNFMKCLMQMYNDQGRAPLFWETVVSLKQQQHTYIECIPIPLSAWHDAPAFFREGILASESDWTQHNPLIDFTKRPGGFRRMMVKDLPYFMVQWDYKGEKGYGHVIEGEGGGNANEEEDYAGEDEGKKGSFPKSFASEIIGNMLEIEPRRWRRPRRVDISLNAIRVRAFAKIYAKYDWTPQLQRPA